MRGFGGCRKRLRLGPQQFHVFAGASKSCNKLLVLRLGSRSREFVAESLGFVYILQLPLHAE